MILRTERLLLRPFRQGDLDALTDTLGRPDVVRYLYWDVQTRDEVADLIARRMHLATLAKPGDRLVLAVERRDTGELAGDVVLGWDDSEHRQGEIGFVFSPAHHGKGFATEAAHATLRYGFDDVGLHRIYGRCDARNTASARVMERLGMRREAHLIENEWFKGEWGSELVYGMLDREWQDSGQ